MLAGLRERRDEKGVLGATADEPLGVYLTAAACKAAGGAWRGGHDVSGHVFMLVLVTAVLGFEAMGVLAQAKQAQGDGDGEGQNTDKVEVDGSESVSGSGARTWILRFVGAIVGLGYWMLLMTAIWFHTWLEKVSPASDL